MLRHRRVRGRVTAEQWLKSDLDLHPAQYTIAACHHPRFSSGANRKYSMQPIWQDLDDNGVDVVLNGHSHN
jgi:hypothetical protein